ncbi:NADPH-dependent 7-cyano-7-deazaguanine reductase QueF [Ramlibacter tataouinensis]|uniref:NADPH-dependent 7-cyano-7-deazaguanine reductase QueF n=1 Tax=Ramlibacter tataouinensis TaxID=94132 RepID=UPI0022F3F29C|nr:NADPH-dependent 7-cyano-7-deazaguanine reductase QueF [Ramlibacter tataouinensis]WBY00853.1 NADPH-dependent 7-cyano-7-deazaguanine reductase QueF [Ramlibacter tataouinensis]
MPNSPDQSPLGQRAPCPEAYSPELLYPIPRAPKRQDIGIGGQPPFFGADLWTAYELSWLTPRGKPVVALAHITVPCETPNIVESKSFKLYVNSFSGSRFASADEVLARLRADIAEAAWRGGGASGSVGVRLTAADAFDQQQVHELDGVLLDRLDIECTHYTPEPSLLTAAFDEQPVEEVLTSNLLKSNCLVTGQPDWGSVQIRYAGPQIDQGGLLRYLVSYRQHEEFHEQCVERIFMDIRRQCRPTRLAVYARYTRRGGLDINPFRTSHPLALPPNVRTARQ